MTAEALSGIRVLDLTESSEQYCGKLFAQLGAEVVLVEPPRGAASRREGPFLGNVVHPEHSLSFAYLNQGKRGMCIDLDQAEGQRLFKSLAATFDVVIESTVPGLMRSRGLDYAVLSVLNPRLVMTSITPFGQTGPYAEYAGGDLVTMALGGLLYLGGYPDSEPMSVGGNQALLAAAQFAAVASLTALWVAEDETREGLGQHVDVSVQECVATALENCVQYVDLEGTIKGRTGGTQRQAGTEVFRCKDGLVYLMAGGIASNRFWASTVNWLVEEGAPDAATLRKPEWSNPAYLETDEAKAAFFSIFTPFAERHSKAELYASGQQRRIPICPVSTTADLMAARQLKHREYFCEVPHPYADRMLNCPGAPYRLSATPWKAGCPAPRLGEHTSQILAQLGYAIDDQAALLRDGITG